MNTRPDINEARIKFNRAFYGNGSITDKIETAYEVSMAYEMRGNSDIGMYFEKIGNYYWCIHRYGKTTCEGMN